MKHLLLRVAVAALLPSALLAQPETNEELATVLTPTRLRQALHDVPASVTVLTAEDMSLYGVRTIPEALRLVPGMAVMRPTGQDYRIGYHGTNILVPRRMNVLIDGVSAYQPAFARVDWVNLPVAFEDIERIEITRSPDSASYGPNSMLAVINIVTKHPRDVERGSVSGTLGSGGKRAAVARAAFTVGEIAVRITAGQERDNGYDVVLRDPPGHDGTRTDRLTLRASTALDGSTSADVQAAFAHAVREVPFVEPYQVTYPDQHVREGYVAATLTRALSARHEVSIRAHHWVNRVRQEWRSCLPTALILPEMYAMWRANPQYATALLAGQMPSGGTPGDDALAAAAAGAIQRLGARAQQPTCVDTDQNLVERRSAVELEDTYVHSEALRMVSGVGLRHQSGSSRTYLGPSQSNSIALAFGHLEYKPRSALTLNAGVYAQHDSLSGHADISPRLGVNLHLDARQSVRLVWSTGTRTPDVQEQRAQWIYHLEQVTPALDGSRTARFFQSAISPGGLVSERIRSTELGYLLTLPTHGLLLDAKAFRDRLTHLISEKLQVSSFEPTNQGAVDLSGAEIQARAAFGAGWSGFVNYAYLRSDNASNPTEQTQYSRHSGALGLARRFGGGWTAALSYSAASGDGVGQSAFGQTEVTLGRALDIAGGRVNAALTVRRLDNKAVSYFRDFGSTLSSSHDRRVQVFGTLSISL